MSQKNNSVTTVTSSIVNAANQVKSVNKSLTPTGNNSVAKVTINPKEMCNPIVNLALPTVYGNCGYYYVPYKGDPINKGELVNKNGINIRYFLIYLLIIPIS